MNLNDTAQFLQDADRFLILTHRRPDGDTLGSAAALCCALRTLGKTAYLWKNPEITPRYMPYTEHLFAPDNYCHDKAVAVDTASASLLGMGWNAPVDLRIDHHPGGGDYAALNYTEPQAAACGEVILHLLELLGVALTPVIATALYIAITTDTNCFRNANTTAHTHRAAAKLMETGIETHKIDSLMFSKSRERFNAEAFIINGAEYRAGGLVAVSSLSLAQKKESGACEDDLDSISALMHQITGVKVGVLLREEFDGWRVSCRTREPYAANLICRALSGGGHERAAGAVMNEPMTPQAARARVISVLFATYPELRC